LKSVLSGTKCFSEVKTFSSFWIFSCQLVNSFIGVSSSLTVPDTPQITNPSTSTNQVNALQNSPQESSDEGTSPNQPLTLNRLTWQTPKTTIAPDISITNEPTILTQHKYNASSLYEWNIDGMSEWQQMPTKPRQEPQIKLLLSSLIFSLENFILP